MANVSVIGSQYGDEGKGRTVDFVCCNLAGKTLVVRYNGGAQAGHTVVLNNKRHIFSQFGSGTLRGCDTYFAEECLFDPLAFLTEKKKLNVNFSINTNFYVNNKCRIVTPYDIVANRIKATLSNQGTCGMGINEAIRRNERFDLSTSLALNDFLSKDRARLISIVNNIYLDFNIRFGATDVKKLDPDTAALFASLISSESVIKFAYLVWDMINKKMLIPSYGLPAGYNNHVFEGAQGLMLDEYFGNYPYVTPSRTGSINITKICRAENLHLDTSYYVARPYISRHGVDDFFQKTDITNFFNIVDNTNIYNDWQKSTYYSFFDFDHWSELIKLDKQYNCAENIAVSLTCIDQIKSIDSIPIYDSIESAKRLIDPIIINIIEFRSMLRFHTNPNPYLKDTNLYFSSPSNN